MAARERARAVDEAVADLAERTLGDALAVAIVAVGGFGRGELAPHSDIDLLFLVDHRKPVAPATLRGLLYPLWDAGFQVGHAVRSPKEAVERAGEDLHAATALLMTRFIAGRAELHEEMADRRARWLRKQARPLARRVVDALHERHRRAERAGWALAPDLKEDIGALRDVHTLGWIEAIRGEHETTTHLQDATDVLTATREALHAEVQRPTDKLRIDLQPRVAARLGIEAADTERAEDELMIQVHTAARTIEHRVRAGVAASLEALSGGPRRSGSVQRLSNGVSILDGNLQFAPTASGLEEAVAMLAARATTAKPVSPATQRWLTDAFSSAQPDPWSAPMLSSFVALLAAPDAAAALELMDHVGAWPVLVPEWTTIRGRAQHDPYHRYTVDGHAFATVAEARRALANDPVARAAAQEAGDLDTLYLGALLHDIGKGSGEDHSVAGERLATSAARRMGLADEKVAEIAALVRHHLLLVDTATRRDLDDGAVISGVAATVRDARLLRLLYILSVADASATGPEAWSDWKAALVGELYRKVLVALERGELPVRSDVALRAKALEAYEPSLAGRVQDVLATLPPSYALSAPVPDMADEVRLLLRPLERGEVRCRIDEGGGSQKAVVTVVINDRPGALARTAGVLALHRMSVRRAQAYSTTEHHALQRFVVEPPGDPDWGRFTEDLEAAYSGRIALDARLKEKIRDYRPAGWSGEVDVRTLEAASEHSTVVEVRAADALGLLYLLATAVSDLDLDIHTAKIDTLGERVVDVFYIRSLQGAKLSVEQAAELRRAISHRIAAIAGG
ncbi:MAG: [protein-PII] uridylyltransferase [Actinomycetota bacterium]|nr:[protein-PII] uridylyltransferase [Actinomycetota bacterium]